MDKPLLVGRGWVFNPRCNQYERIDRDGKVVDVVTMAAIHASQGPQR